MKRLIYIASLILLSSDLAGQAYFLNGNAQALGNDCYAVTPAQGWQNGTVWYSDLLDLTQSFDLEFVMNYGNIDVNGADGMVFVMQTVGTNAMGFNGGGMGFGGFMPSFGIEFDTYQNSDFGDLAADHLAFLKNGNVNHYNADNLLGPVQTSSISANVEDGADHIVRINWDEPSQTISCYFDCVLRLSMQIDLVGTIFNGTTSVYWGFTGSTGALFNLQTVCLSEYILGTGDDVSICPGETTQLIASGPEDGIYSWTPEEGLDNPGIQNPIASPDQTTTYTVTYTDLCGTQQSDIVTVEVDPYPTADPITSAIFCEDETGLLEVNSTNTGITYQWSTADGNISGSTTGSDIIVTQDGTYTVTITNGAGCSASFEGTAQTQAIPSWFVPEPSYLICPDEELILNTNSGTWTSTWTPLNTTGFSVTIEEAGAYEVSHTDNVCEATYSFSVDQVVFNLTDLGPDIQICETETAVLSPGAVVEWNTGATAAALNVNSTGTYSYVYTLDGCETSDEIFVQADDFPEIDLGPDQEICINTSLVLEINYTGTWNTGESADAITVSDAGTYSVSVQNGMCSNSDIIDISIIPLPEIDLGPDYTYCLGESVRLSAGHEYAENWIWNDGSDEDHINVNQGGIYFVDVSNNCGLVSDTVAISFIECEAYVFVPNAFTPDQDGLNDVWKPEVYNISSYEVIVIDRWGSVVFQSEDPNQYWTGNAYNGDHYVQDGVYVWIVRYASDFMDIQELRGTVMLMR